MDKQVSYDVLLRKLKSAVNTSILKFGGSKIGLHFFRRGPVSASVKAETAPITNDHALLLKILSIFELVYMQTFISPN